MQPSDVAKAHAMLRDHTISVTAIAEMIGVLRTTIYTYLPEARTRVNAPAAAPATEQP